MSKVNTSIEIGAPPEQVWEVVVDPQRLGDWVTIHRELVSADDGELREGFAMKQRLSIRGAPVTVSWTLAELDAPRRVVWEGKGPAGSKARTVYALSATDAGTSFDYENEFKPPGGPVGAIASKVLIGGVPDEEARASLRRLKELMES